MRFAGYLLLICTLAGVGAAGDVETVLEKHREFLGIDAVWDSLETIEYTGTIASGGMTGTISIQVVLPTRDISLEGAHTDFPRGIYYRSEIVLGPLYELVLITPGGAWIEDSNGGVRELSGIELEDYTTSMVMDSFLYCYQDPFYFGVTNLGTEEVSGATCDVLEYGPIEGGLPFHPRRLYLDAEDGRLRRVQSELDMMTHFTDLSDYREFDGIRLPTRAVTTLIGLDYEIKQTIDDMAINDGVDMRLFLPPVKAGLAFPEGRDRVGVPLEFVGDAVFVPVRVNGEELLMLLDTGASMSVLSTSVVERLGIEPAGTEVGAGAGGMGELHVVSTERLEIGGLALEGLTMAAIDLSPYSRHFGVEWGGILGYELFARTVVEIDYEEETLTLYDPGTYAAPEPRPGVVEVLPLELGEGLPRVEAEFDGVKGPFTVDLGNLNYTTIYRPAVVEHGLFERYPDWRPYLITGFGGTNLHRLVRLDGLRLGSINIDSPLVVLTSEVGGALARSREVGNLGQDILKRFRRVTLDYNGGRLILEVDADGLKPGILPNRLGFSARGNEVVVIWAGSPAERAGLREGDVITALDGEPFDNFTALQLVEWVGADPGTKRTLTALRGGESLEFPMVTEDLW